LYWSLGELLFGDWLPIHLFSGSFHGAFHFSARAIFYEVVLEEARIVRQMFMWVGQEHLSLSEVSRRLEKQGVPTRTGLRRWSSATIAALLKNPAFIGQACFGKTRVEPWRAPCGRGVVSRQRRGGLVR
jgi:site-specific DNA recombinase